MASKLDPELTPHGLQQVTGLGQLFPSVPQVGVIISSPLKRAVQTTLTAFPYILYKQYFDPESGHGVENGAVLFLNPNLQERSALPCDTGSPTRVLETAFPRLGFQDLVEDWQVKEGLYSRADEAVEERARRVRSRIAAVCEDLQHQGRTDVVVVTHGVFMRFLLGDPDIDLPKAGWKSWSK